MTSLHRIERLARRGLIEVASDSTRAAEMAAEHLLGRGVQHFAIVGISGRV